MTIADDPLSAGGGAAAGQQKGGLRLGSLCGVLLVTFLYSLTHAVLHFSLSSNIAQDDVIANIYSQALQWGYDPRQPPLYDWLLWGVQQFTGPTLISFLLLKYALLIATTGFAYAAARRVLRDPNWAAAGAFSLSLLHQIGWNIHEGVTHTAVMMCAIAASLWALMRLAERQHPVDYLLFGLAVGLGGLTKYGYAAFLAVLIGSALLQPGLRAALLDRKICLSVLTALVLVLPYARWLLVHGHDLVGVYDATLTEPHGYSLTAGLRGAARAGYSALAFLLPLAIILPLIFPGWGRAALASGRGAFERPSTHPDWERLLIHMTLLALASLLVLALATGATRLVTRYMHPFFLLAPIWLVAVAKHAANRPGQLRRLGLVICATAALVVPLRLGYLVIGDWPFCRKCRQMTPYDGLAQALKARNFRSGTIVAGYRHTAGNLRQLFPDARLINTRGPHYVPPPTAHAAGKVAIVWETFSEGSETPDGIRKITTAMGLPLSGEPETVRIPWNHLWRKTGYRQSEWKLLVVDRKDD